MCLFIGGWLCGQSGGGVSRVITFIHGFKCAQRRKRRRRRRRGGGGGGAVNIDQIRIPKWFRLYSKRIMPNGQMSRLIKLVFSGKMCACMRLCVCACLRVCVCLWHFFPYTHLQASFQEIWEVNFGEFWCFNKRQHYQTKYQFIILFGLNY